MVQAAGYQKGRKKRSPLFLLNHKMKVAQFHTFIQWAQHIYEMRKGKVSDAESELYAYFMENDVLRTTSYEYDSLARNNRNVALEESLTSLLDAKKVRITFESAKELYLISRADKLFSLIDFMVRDNAISDLDLSDDGLWSNLSGYAQEVKIIKRGETLSNNTVKTAVPAFNTTNDDLQLLFRMVHALPTWLKDYMKTGSI